MSEGRDQREDEAALGLKVERLRRANGALQHRLSAALSRAEAAERMAGEGAGQGQPEPAQGRLRRLFSRPSSHRAAPPPLAKSSVDGLWVNPAFAVDPPRPDDLIAFFHAQRTGGSALRHLFAGALGPDRVYATQFVDAFRHWEAVPAEDLTEKTVFAGHSNFAPRDLGRRVRPVTLVRHPFYRTVSLYFYCKKYPNQFLHELTEGRDLQAFYEVASARKPTYFHNVLCRRIAGEPSCDAALDRLSERFVAVGATERLGDFARWLFANEGLTAPEVKRQPPDRERYDEHLADEGFVARVMRANDEDARLFEALNAAGLGLPPDAYPKRVPS